VSDECGGGEAAACAGPVPGESGGDDPGADWLGPAMSRRLAAFARRFVRDPGEAEDVAQEALLRAREKLATLRSPGKIEAWLFRICRHAAIDHSRARRVRRAVWAPMPESGAPARAAEPLEAPLVAPLDLRALPPHQRLLLSLHYERGLSHPTLCRMTGLLPSALRVRLFRARGALQLSVRG